ncbi:MAG: hypothetical protein AB7V46_02835 [Thermomicrobiales bacterium]
MTSITGSGSATGTRDVTYNLISVAYHALQGIETYRVYAEDAEQSGNQELREFFVRAQDLSRQMADEATQHLGQVLGNPSR